MNITVAPRGAELNALTAGAIVTHQSPDWDAIGAVYFARKIVGYHVPVVLVPAGTLAAAMPHAAVIVDTGGVYNREAPLRIDHHQWTDNDTSATALTMQLCMAQSLNPGLSALVRTITAADLGKAHDGAKESRETGLHALLSSWKFRRMSDEEMMWRGTGILEAIEHGHTPAEMCAMWPEDMAAYALARAAAVEEYARCLVYASSDGKVVALDGAGPLASQEAYANGAVLVVFHNALSGAVGISRAGEAVTPHVGKLVEFIASTFDAAAIAAELADWFRHPAGFYAGLSPKADNVRPLGLPLATVAAAVDAAWLRS